MKIKYTFVNGETSTVEVSEEIGTLIMDSRRKEHADNERHRYHCYSYDAIEYEGEEYASKERTESHLIEAEDNERIASAMSKLTETQRRRLLLLMNGKSMREIARMENANYSSAVESITAARKNFLKNYNKF